MNEIRVFNNKEFGLVRTVTIDSIPYFVGKDVADILGYAKPENAIAAHVDDEDKTTTLIQGTGSNYKSKAVVINESGLYSLIFSSKMPNAKKFKHWVTSEVLPSIRKHGLYATHELLDNPDIMIKALQELKAERQRSKELMLISAVQKQQIAELKPKASYYDLILQNKNTVPITQIAKDYGMSGRAFNKMLHELGIQYKLRGTWLLYQEYADQGYTQSRTHAIDAERSVMHTYWTQKDRLFLYELLRSKRNLLPIIERGAL